MDIEHQTPGPIILPHFHPVKHKPHHATTLPGQHPHKRRAAVLGIRFQVLTRHDLAAGTPSTLFLALSAVAPLASYGSFNMLEYFCSWTTCFSFCPERFFLRYSHCLLPYFTQLSGQKASWSPLTTLLKQLCRSACITPLPVHSCPLSHLCHFLCLYPALFLLIALRLLGIIFFCLDDYTVDP